MNTVQIGNFLFNLGRSSVEAGVVVALVLLAQWLFREQLAPRWRSALWLLVVMRLLLFFSFASVTSIFNFVPHWKAAAAPRPAMALAAPAAVAPAPAGIAKDRGASDAQLGHVLAVPPRRGWAWQIWFFTAWLAGAIILGGHVLVSSFAFRKHCARLKPCVAPGVLTVFRECCDRFGLTQRPALLESPVIDSPALYGLFRPRLLLPMEFAGRFSPAEMRFIFLHELAHLKRRDLLVNWLMVALQVAHWFNPLVWFGFTRWRADRELACDALALEIAGPEQSRDYGRTVLRLLEMVARPVSTPGLVGILEDKRQLRRRIDMIATYMPSRRWPRLAFLLIAALAVVGLTDAQSSSSPSQAETTPAAPSQLAQELIGTWILVGKPGKVGKAPSRGGRYKFFTGSQGCITQADADTGVVIFHHGGSYKLEGDEYFESVDYAEGSTITHVGNKNRYKITIEGDTLTDIGDGNPWREVWKRVPTKVDASQPLLQNLVGAWELTYEAGDTESIPAGVHAYKLITPSGWCDTTADPKTSVVVYHHGGDFTLKGNRYVEHVKYANPNSMGLIGHSSVFDIAVDGDTLRMTGIHNPWNEIWKRVK